MQDVIIVGGGLAALASAHACSQFGLSTLVIGRTAGGQLLESPLVESVSGAATHYGPELAKRLAEQAQGVTFKQAEVTEVRTGFTLFNVTDHANDKHRAKAVIIASGREPAMLRVAGEDEFLGKGITTKPLTDLERLKDQAVAVYGSGERAGLLALWLSGACPKVHLVSSQPRMSLLPRTRERISHTLRIEPHMNAKITRVAGTLNLDSIYLDKAILRVGGLVLAEAGAPSISFLKVSAPASDGLIVDEHMRCADGLFACGSAVSGASPLPAEVIAGAWKAAASAARHAKK